MLDSKSATIVLLGILLIYIGSMASNFYYSYRSYQVIEKAEKYILETSLIVDKCREVLEGNER